MKIGIVIPCYNAAKYLAQTLESVLAQTASDWQLIVVDDGSKDDSAAIAQSFAAKDPRIRSIAQENAGVSVARNTGLAQIDPDTDYVTFLDADDLWEPDTLEMLAAALDKNPHAVAAYGGFCLINAQGISSDPEPGSPYEMKPLGIRAGRLVEWPGDLPISLAVLAFRNCILTGSILVRHRAMGQAGLFDRNLAFGEDWDIWVRLSLLGDIVRIDRQVFRYRLHGANTSFDKKKMYRDEQALRRKLVALPQLTGDERQLMRQAWRLAERERSHSMLQWAWQSVLEGKPLSAIQQIKSSSITYLHYLMLPHG